MKLARGERRPARATLVGALVVFVFVLLPLLPQIRVRDYLLWLAVDSTSSEGRCAWCDLTGDRDMMPQICVTRSSCVIEQVCDAAHHTWTGRWPGPKRMLVSPK